MSEVEPPGPVKQDSAKGFADSPVSSNVYVVMRLAPPVSFLVLGLTNREFLLSAVASILLVVADFYLTKNYFGMELVGLRWQVDPNEAPQFPFVVFDARPFPFVASTSDSNVFWLFLVISTVLDFVLFVVFAALGRGGWVLIAALATALCVVNISAFMRCHQMSRAQADSAARTLLLDTSVTMFQAAKDPAQESSSASDPEEEIE